MEEYLDFRDDTGFNSPYHRKSAYFFLKKCSREDKSFKPFTEFYQMTMENGISRERMGFTGENGKERYFTGENGR